MRRGNNTGKGSREGPREHAGLEMVLWIYYPLKLGFAEGWSWVTDIPYVEDTELRAKGFADYYRHLDVMRAQNLSNLEHAHVIVIRSEFSDVRGKPRSAMGCGFASNSYRDAELDAVRDLQAYFWGWKPDHHGYQVVRKFRY